MRFIIRWGINAAALWAAVAILGPNRMSYTKWTDIVMLALIFGFVNALLRPVLKVLTCPLIIITLGLFTLVINTFLFLVTTWIGSGLGINLFIADSVFWNAFWGALIVSGVSVILSLILKDELRSSRHHHHDHH
jgi:putative membrane protein